MSSGKKRLLRHVSLAALLAAGCLAADAEAASAYTGTNAAAYADNWATARNGSYPQFSSDCTNFVSQAASHGGYPFRNTGGSGTDSWWFLPASVTGSVWQYSTSWVNVQAYYNFLLNDYPGGIPEGTDVGSATHYYTPDAEVTGDVIVYDWGRGLGMSHANMQVGIGDDPNLEPSQVWYGNYIDQHTTDRYHAFWSLKPYNSDWATTTIYFMHIDASN